MFRLITKNDKIKKTEKLNKVKIKNWTLPAILTCPFAGACKKFCYGNKGCYRFSNVTTKHLANLSETFEKDFVVDMFDELIRSNLQYFRIHDSGDFYNNKKYLNDWLLIISALPDITFYCYTKSHRYFNKNNTPKNLIIIKSFGGLDDNLIDIKKDRHAMIFEKGKMPKDYISVDDNDLNAIGSNKKIGITKH